MSFETVFIYFCVLSTEKGVTVKMETYLFIDIDDLHYNNRISQINPDLYEQYYNMLNEIKDSELKVEILRFTMMYEKEEYEIPMLFETINKFVLDILNMENLRYLNIHTTYNNLLIALLISEKIKQNNKNIIIILSGKYLRTIYKNMIKSVDYIDLFLNKYSCKKNYYAIKEKELKYSIGLINKRYIYLMDDVVYYYNFNNKQKQLNEKIKFEGSVLNNSILLENIVKIKVGEGCIFNCNYCTFKNFYFNQYNQLENTDIINIMELYHYNYGTSNFILEHELFIKEERKLIEFCNMLIKTNNRFAWSCSTRLDYLNKENIKLMVKAGCECLFIGIESGSNTTQKQMNKNIDLEKVLLTVEQLAENGINAIFSFIYKYPGELQKDIVDTFKLMYSIKEIEFKNKNSIFLYELSKIKFFPGTQITKKYYNRLEFDKFRNIDILTYPPEIIEFIKKNKAILTDFFNLKENINQKYERFEEFVAYIFNDYIYMDYNQIKEILIIYDYDLNVIYNNILRKDKEKLYKLLDLVKEDKVSNNDNKHNLCNYLLQIQNEL